MSDVLRIVVVTAVAVFALYPLVGGISWILFSLVFHGRFERHPKMEPLPSDPPLVSVVVPAYAEEQTIEKTLAAALRLDYPAFEVIVVDDRSPDRLLEVVGPYLADPRVRLISKESNEGKALAVNDAALLARGDLLLVLDSDGVPAPDSLRWLVPHFADPTVAAVTGNPLVLHDEGFLVRLQAIEFASIIGLIRRAHQLWQHPLTVSGVFTLYRRPLFLEMGGFDPLMQTEDIDMTWRLQLRNHRIVFEPNALVWIHVPGEARDLWRQRCRWAAGLGEALHRHGRELARRPRMWLLAGDSLLAIVWSCGFALAAAAWLAVVVFTDSTIISTPWIAWWGILVGLVGLVQITVAALIGRRHDPVLVRYLPNAVFYVLGFWMIGAGSTARSTLGPLLRGPAREGSVRWDTYRGS